jgi:hypothetical protein
MGGIAKTQAVLSFGDRHGIVWAVEIMPIRHSGRLINQAFDCMASIQPEL